jgi:Galactose oxidase, central domain/Kelch motif
MTARSRRRDSDWSVPPAVGAPAHRRTARLARALRTRWWPRFLLAGVLPVVIGTTLFSGVAGAWVVGAGAVIICIFVMWLLSINPYRESSGGRELAVRLGAPRLTRVVMMRGLRRFVVAVASVFAAVLLLAPPALSVPVSLGAWRVTGPLITARYYHTATLLPNGKVLVAGGNGSIGSGGILASAELYDPSTSTWRPTAPLGTRREFHTATLLPNGEVLVAGGNGPGFLNSAELYDPTSGTWSPTGSLITARYFHTATLLPNGKVLVAGGNGPSGILNSAELYDPSTSSWSLTAPMITRREFHTATLLLNGEVLVAGGFGFLRSAELYDPSSGKWTLTIPMITGRYGQTATLLLNGKVLVAGGYGSSGFLNSVELYDPTSGTWRPTGPLGTARYFHTATLLRNGKVLVAGGQNLSGALASAELYTPAPPTCTGCR